MKLITSRFGEVDFQADEVIQFPRGLFGFEAEHRWLLLADAHHRLLYWVQSVDRPEISLPVVCPFQVIEGYRLTVPQRQLAEIGPGSSEGLIVLTELVQHADGVAINLRMPIVINLRPRRGRQVVINDVQAAQQVPSHQSASLRKAA